MTAKDKQELYSKIRTKIQSIALNEPNNKITRDRIVESVNEILQKYEDLRLICEYVFVCDETENQKEIVESNQLRSTLIYKTRPNEKSIMKHFDVSNEIRYS